MDCKYIPLKSRDEPISAIVDAADYDWLRSWTWRPNGEGYAVRTVGGEGGRRMHRLIVDAPSGMDVDHINGNRLDNRRGNLRLCTRSQNLQNSRPREGGTSRYKGVCFGKNHGRYQVEITHNGERHHLGLYEDEVEAARTYDAVARCLFGEFARTNLAYDEEVMSVMDVKRRQWALARGATSGYRGVYFKRQISKWVARIKVSGTEHYLGSFATDYEAAIAYDKKALELLGQNAQTNFDHH